MKNIAGAARLLALFVSIGMLGGCAKYYRVDPVLKHPLQKNANGGEDGEKKVPIDIGGEHRELYEKAKDNPGARNQLQTKIIELSDDVCEQHKGDVIANASQFNLATGIGATVFSSVSAIVTGAAATNYATGATILNGTNTAVNAEIYQGLFVTAIIKAIEESRGKKINEILAKQLEDTGKYSVDTAIVDAQDYHFRCSFYHGLVVLNEDAKKRATPSRAELLGKIEVLREEMKKNNLQKGLTNKETIKKDNVNIKIQQGIDALYDKLNLTD